MCGGGRLIERAFPPDQTVAGVIVRMSKGYIFYPAYQGGIEGARTLSRRICVKNPLHKIVYSGRPHQLQTRIKNLNKVDGLKGYSPVEDFYHVRGGIT